MVLTTLILLRLLLTLLSVRYWFVFFKAKSITSLFPFYPDRCKFETPLPFFLVILWISLSFYTAMITAWRQWQTPDYSPDVIKLQDVITHCSISFSFGFVLVLFLFILNRNSMQKLGFRINDGFGQIRDGFIGFLLSLIPVMSILLVTQPFRSEETLHPLFHLLKEQPYFSTIAWIFISAVVVAPLLEELIYRVIFQSWLENFLDPLGAITVSSLIFSIVHGFPDCIALFPLAFILGTLFYYRRSYIAVVFTHSLFNSMNLGFALANQ